MAFTEKKFITYENINKYIIGSGGQYHLSTSSGGHMPIILWSGYLYATTSSATSWIYSGSSESACGPGISGISVSYSQHQLTVTVNKTSDVSSVTCNYALVNDRCYWTADSGNQRGCGWNSWRTWCSGSTVYITFVEQQDSKNDSVQAGYFNESFFYPSSTTKNKVSGYGGINLIIYGYVSWVSNSIYNASVSTVNTGNNYILSTSNHNMPNTMVPPCSNLQYAYHTTNNYPYCLAILKISKSGSISSSLYSTSNAGSTLTASVSAPSPRYIQISLSSTNNDGTIKVTGIYACGNDCAGYTEGRGGQHGGMQQFTCCNNGTTIYVSSLKQRDTNNDSWDCVGPFTTSSYTSTYRYNYFWVYIFGYKSKTFSFDTYGLRLTYMDPSSGTSGYSPLKWLMPRTGDVYMNSSTLITRIPTPLFWGTVSFNSSGTPSFTLYYNNKINVSTSYTSTSISFTMTNNDTGYYVYGYAIALNNSSNSTRKSFGYPLYYCTTNGGSTITVQGFRQDVANNDKWRQITWSEGIVSGVNIYALSILCLGYTNISEAQESVTYYTYSTPVTSSNISATANGTVSLTCTYIKYTHTNGSTTQSNQSTSVDFIVTPNEQNTTRIVSAEWQDPAGITHIVSATQNAGNVSVSLSISGNWDNGYTVTFGSYGNTINCEWIITRTYNGSTTTLYESNGNTSTSLAPKSLSSYNSTTWEQAGATYTITASADTSEYDYGLYTWSNDEASVTRSVSQNSSSVTLSVSATTISNGGYVTLTATPSVAGTIVITIPTAAYNSGLRLNTSSNTSTTYTMSNVTTSGSTVKLYNVNSSTSSNATVSANTIYGTLSPNDAAYSGSTGYLSSALTLTKATPAVTYSIQGNFFNGYELVGSDGSKPSVSWTIKRGSTTVGTKTTTKVVPPTFISSNKAIVGSDYANSFYDSNTQYGSNFSVNNTTGYINDIGDMYTSAPIVNSGTNTYDIMFYSPTVSSQLWSNQYYILVKYSSSNPDDMINYESDDPTYLDDYWYQGYQTYIYANKVQITGTGYWSFNMYGGISDLYSLFIDNPNITYTIETTYNSQTYSTTYTTPNPGTTYTLDCTVLQASSISTFTVSSTTISNGGYVTLTIKPSVAGSIRVSIPQTAYNNGLRVNTSSNTNLYYTVSNVSTSGTTVRLYNVRTDATSNTISANTIYAFLTPNSSGYKTATRYLSSALTLECAVSDTPIENGLILWLDGHDLTTGNNTWGCAGVNTLVDSVYDANWNIRISSYATIVEGQYLQCTNKRGGASTQISSNYVSSDNPLYIIGHEETDDITFEIVFKLDGTNRSDSYTLDRLWGCTYAGGTSTVEGLWRWNGEMNNDGTLSIKTFNGSTWLTALTTTTNIDDGNFHYMTLTKSGSLISLYVDGQLEDSITNTDFRLNIKQYGYAIGIGRYDGLNNTSESGVKGLKGNYYSYAMYNRALSTNEILSNYATYNYLYNN